MTDNLTYTGNPERDIAVIRDIVAEPGWCSLDFETTVSRALQREVCTVQVTHDSGREALAYVYGPHWQDLVYEALADAQCRFIAHNAIFERECLYRCGLPMLRVECTMVAAKVLRGSMEGDKAHRTLWSLKALAKRELGVERDKTIRDRDWREPPDQEALDYGLDDTRDALALWDIYLPLFEADEQQDAGYRAVMDSLNATTESNLTGLPFDHDAHARLCVKMEEQKAREEFLLDALCWCQIDNVGSDPQVGRWVIETMMADGFTDEQKTPDIFAIHYAMATGDNWPLTGTGKLALGKPVIEQRLKHLEPIAPDVAAFLRRRVVWRKAAKLLQAFGPALAAMVDPDGNVRGSTRPHGAQTSRESCAAPNLQQMPTEPEFRACFRAKPGRKLVICDYGQIELRVGCLLADDTSMQAVFAAGVDIHQASATKIKRILSGDDTAEATPAERKASKQPTFASLYGAQASTIAINSGLSYADAEALLQAWLKAYPGIDNYRNTVFDEATLDGGIRLVSGQWVGMANDTRPAQVINAPVQGSSASVMYRAKKRVHDGVLRLRAEGCDVRFCIAVHDEIILDAAEADAEAAKEMLQNEMTTALLEYYPRCAELNMATLAEAGVVDTWAEKG